MRVVEKPWGSETIWAETERYAGKILHVRAGASLSLQFHRTKDETLMLLSGLASLLYYAPGDDATPSVITLSPRVPFHVPAGMRHRLSAVTDAEVLEVSSPELDDVVRLVDNYGR